MMIIVLGPSGAYHQAARPGAYNPSIFNKSFAYSRFEDADVASRMYPSASDDL